MHLKQNIKYYSANVDFISLAVVIFNQPLFIMIGVESHLIIAILLRPNRFKT